MKKSFYRRHRVKIWYGLMIFVMLFSFAVLGPLAQNYLIDSQKPYILVDSEHRWEILKAKASGYTQCEIPPYTPVEITGNPSGKVDMIVMDSVPLDYLPYVHYPDNWNQWWNIFNPTQPLGPTVKNVLTFITPAMALGLIIYGTILWKRGRLKNVLRNLLPHEDD